MRHLRKFACAIFAISTAGATSSALAHDFWIAPDSYATQVGQDLDISIMIGHPTDRLDWPINPHRIISFRAFGPQGISDYQANITGLSGDENLSVVFDTPGTHLLVIETTQSFSKLESEHFNAYLEEEGLTPIKLDRVRNRKTGTAGTEVYSRRGKTIIQVGPPKDTDASFVTEPVGMTLEVVPTANPAHLPGDKNLTSRIYYRGKPQPGVSVGLVDLSGDKGLVQRQVSDEKGYVTFAKPDAGAWMQHAVWSDPIEEKGRADYDTVFSSLSFSIP